MEKRNTRIWSRIQEEIIRNALLNGSKNETPKHLVDPDEILKEYLHGIQESNFPEGRKN